MFSKNVIATVGTVVVFVQTSVQHEGNAAAEGIYAADQGAPEIGDFTDLLIDDSRDCFLAAGTGQLHGVVVVGGSA